MFQTPVLELPDSVLPERKGDLYHRSRISCNRDGALNALYGAARVRLLSTSTNMAVTAL